MRFERDSPKMVQRQLGHDHMEIAIQDSVGGEWPKKDKPSMPRRRGSGTATVFGGCVLVRVCAEFTEGDFRTRPRPMRTLDYVADLKGKLREEMEEESRKS